MEYHRELPDQAKEIRSSVLRWIQSRENTVHTMRVLADKLTHHHNNVCIAQVAGSSASIAGFGFMAAGFGFSFLTGGLSLILAGAGAVVSVAGGLTNGGSTIAENCIKKETFDNIQKIIEKDREALKAIEELWGTFKDDINRNEVKNGVKAGFQFASMINTCGQTGYKLGVAVGKTASITGSEAVFRGLSSLGKVVHIGGFAVSAALLPLDIYNLVQNAKKVDASRNGKSDHEPNEVKVLKELADKLAEEIPDENEIDEMIENLIKMRKPSAPMEIM